MSSLSLLPHPRRLIEIGPHAGAHRVAVRAALAIGIPLVTLALAGRLDLSLYAVFGAFTALYGRTHTHLPRLRMQATAAVALVAAVTLGAAIGASPARDWLVVPVAAAVAGVATILSDALRWHPPGALFFVFALAACASVPTPPAQVATAFALAVASALLAMAISTVGLATRVRELAHRIRPATPRPTALGRATLATADGTPPTPTRHPGAAARHGMRAAFVAVAGRPGELGKVALVAGAVLVAGAIPTATGVGHPYWAMVAAVAALGAADATGHLVRAGHRVLGTLFGVLLAGALLAVSTDARVLIAAAILLQLGAELFVMRNYGLTMVFVTPLALIMTQLAHPQPALPLLRDRALETLLGAAVAIALSVALALWAQRASRTV